MSNIVEDHFSVLSVLLLMLSKQKFSELILQIINFVKDVKILNIQELYLHPMYMYILVLVSSIKS